MNIALWIIAGLLAVIFLASGVVKLMRSKEKLVASGMGFVEYVSSGTVKAIGALEILAAVGSDPARRARPGRLRGVGPLRVHHRLTGCSMGQGSTDEQFSGHRGSR
jgi:hypothetical protein